MMGLRNTVLGAALAFLAACGSDTEETTGPVNDGDEPFIAPDGEMKSIDGGLSDGEPAPEIDDVVRAAEVQEERDGNEPLPSVRSTASIDIAEDDGLPELPEDIEETIEIQSALNDVERAPESQPESPVTAFIQESTVENPNIALAMAIGPEGFDEARQTLESSSDRDRQGRAALLLGFSEREEASAILSEYVVSGPDETISGEWYNAKRDALFAMGYLANVSEGEHGLAFLLSAARPEFWEEQGIVWQSPFFATAADQNMGLAQLSLLALVLSGRPEAEAEFQRLVSAGARSGGTEPVSAEEARGLIAEWRKVRAMGIADYSAQGL